MVIKASKDLLNDSRLFTKRPHTAGGDALSRSKQSKYIINEFNGILFV